MMEDHSIEQRLLDRKPNRPGPPEAFHNALGRIRV
jgi:hypothetical protein